MSPFTVVKVTVVRITNIKYKAIDYTCSSNPPGSGWLLATVSVLLGSGVRSHGIPDASEPTWAKLVRFFIIAKAVVVYSRTFVSYSNNHYFSH